MGAVHRLFEGRLNNFLTLVTANFFLMKKLIFCFLIMAGFSRLNAQKYIKMPLDKNHYWQQHSNDSHSNVMYSVLNCDYLSFVHLKDTLINGKMYTPVSSGGTCDVSLIQPYAPDGLLREDTLLQRINILIGNTEYILYNFNKNAGDTAVLYSPFDGDGKALDTFKVTLKDSVLLSDGLYHPRFGFNQFKVIEGVGGLNGLITPYYSDFESSRTLICFGTINPSLPVYDVHNNYIPCNLITLSIPSPKEKNNYIHLLPNPANEILNIECLMMNGEKTEIRICDATGREIKSAAIQNTKTEINVREMEPGIYFADIFIDGKLAGQKKLAVMR